MNGKEIQADFLQQLGGSLQLCQLFEELPDIYFFAKNSKGEFVLCNSAILDAMGLASQWDMIGKTDYDLVPREIADVYHEADQQVIQTGLPVRNIVEPVPGSGGVLNWYITSKTPIIANNGKVIGVAVAMRDYERVGSVLAPYQEFTPVIEFIFQNYHQQILVEQLAAIVELSVRQFERRFKKLFSMTPMSYINRYRVRAACIALWKTGDSISRVAINSGFYDHSHFVKHFRQVMGMTPSQYRKTQQGSNVSSSEN
ncbi:MAG: AraC family transcriptional regulator [Blastopirellula sp.]|nr:MAG: AraC family transcriptional regulator [Blastopirellula sp.]